MNLHRLMDEHGWTVNAKGCWVYGPPFTYGQIDGRAAHRVAYERWVGPIPDGHVVRHRCDNPPCINPEHLITGTQGQNIQDMIDRGRHLNLFGRDLVDRSAGRATPEDAEQARRMYLGGATPRQVATALGVSKATAKAMRPEGLRWDQVRPRA